MTQTNLETILISRQTIIVLKDVQKKCEELKAEARR
jgi:hypothetical protein